MAIWNDGLSNWDYRVRKKIHQLAGDTYNNYGIRIVQDPFEGNGKPITTGTSVWGHSHRIEVRKDYIEEMQKDIEELDQIIISVISALMVIQGVSHELRSSQRSV